VLYEGGSGAAQGIVNAIILSTLFWGSILAIYLW
jgi:hypothetical protein